MVTVQPTGCAPIVRAFEQGIERAPMWENPDTEAHGLRVPKAIGDFLVLRAIRESGGTALAVTDRQMVDDMLLIGRLEGISAAPEGAAALSATRMLLADGRMRPDETVVLFNTGGALKYLEVLRSVR
jgi:threonine synthase